MPGTGCFRPLDFSSRAHARDIGNSTVRASFQIRSLRLALPFLRRIVSFKRHHLLSTTSQGSSTPHCGSQVSRVAGSAVFAVITDAVFAVFVGEIFTSLSA